jgi:hypothetical protein
MMGTVVNPFRTWAELVRGLRDRFVAGLGEERPVSAHAGEVLGQLAALATRCDHMGATLQRLQDGDPAAFDAFVEALRNSEG